MDHEMTNIKTVLDSYRKNIQQYRQWLAEFPEVAHVLDTLSATVEGTHCLNSGTPFNMEYCTIQGLREQLRKMRGEKEAAVLAASAQNRHGPQKEGKHPAPCARFCEATAFNIEIAGLRKRIADLQASQSPQDQVKEK